MVLLGENQKLETIFTADNSELLSAIKASVQAIKDFGNDAKTFGKKVGDSFKNVSKETGVVTTAVNGLKKAFKSLIALRIGKYLASAISQSISYIERLNLFRVATGQSVVEMTKFVNTMSEMFGLDPSNLMKTVGTFRQLAGSIGLARSEADLLATNLTKAAVDIASLFEISVESAIEKLQAGLVGLPKSLRDIGIITTVNALQQEAYSLGIQESVENMSEVNKVGLRYIAIMRQMKNAMGDFAKTIESPANQLRILREQLTQLSRAIGNLFVNAVSKVLPYLNALIMTLRVVIQTVASFMGFKDNVFENSIGNATDSVGGLGDEVSGTAKKMKQLIAPFDELNILQEQSGDAESGFGTGGMDPRIVEAMKEYDNLMGSVKMKANDIRDRMLDILGFTKQINEETGEIAWTWNLDDFKEGLAEGWELLQQWWKTSTPGEKFATVFTTGWVTWLTSKGIGLLLTPFKGLLKGIMLIVKEIPKLFGSEMTTTIGGVLSNIGGAVSGMSLGVVATIAGAIAAIGLAIWDLWKNNEEFRDKVIALWDQMKENFKQLWADMKTAAANTVEALKTLWTKFSDFFKVMFKNEIEAVTNFIKDLWTHFKDSVGEIVLNLLEAFNGFLEFLSGVFTGDIDKATKGLEKLFKNMFYAILNVGVFVINAIISAFEAGINWAINAINGLIEAYNSLVSQIPGIGSKMTISTFSNVKFERVPVITDSGTPSFYNGGMPGAGTIFEAGEKGKAEVIGNYGGKTTVMPLENTSFVGAMRDAVRAGVVAGMEQTGGQGDVPIKVIIGGREWDTEIYRAGQRGKARVGQMPIGGAFSV